jgi:hypothetical protein
MDEVFRFMFLRPPVPASPVVVNPSQPFAASLQQAQAAADRRAALKAAATQVVQTRGVDNLSDLHFGLQLVAVESALGNLAPPSSQNPIGKQVFNAIKAAFGNKTPTQVVALPDFVEDRERLADNLLAAKLLSRDSGLPARRLESLLRIIAVIQRSAVDDQSLNQPGAVGAALSRPTRIGESLAAPVRDLPADQPPDEPDEPDPAELREQIAVLDDVRQTLTRLPAGSFALPDETPPPVPSPPAAPGSALGVLRSTIVGQLSGPLENVKSGSAAAIATDLKSLQQSSTIPAPTIAAHGRLRLRQSTVDAIPQAQHEALTNLGLDLTSVPVPAALAKVNSTLTDLHAELMRIEEKKSTVAVFGSNVYDVGQVTGHGSGAGLPESVPTTHGTVTPVGVGDLLVVRQQLKRYEAGEIGHIENVLRGELRERTHLRSRTTEETVTVEVETKRDEERDTQSTERSELQRETAEIVKQDTTFKTGVAVSGSYGPTVEFKATADFALDTAKEESAKVATGYSKEITDRAVSRLSERRREERIRRTLEVFEETNKHTVDNKGKNDNTVGIYQWVDKVYEAQVYNYGRRMMYDIMLPEPAAFWIYANTNKPKAGATLVKPKPFTARPDQINENNYAFYVQKYQVVGVKPPPEPYRTVSKTFDGEASYDTHGASKALDVPIPDGYEAVSGDVVADATWWEDWSDTWEIKVSIGKEVWRRHLTNYANHYFTLDNEQGSVPLSILAYGVHFWVVAIEVDCQRTERAYQDWQLATHAAILQGYQKMERDYRDELAALEVQAASEVQGRNPIENRLIERTELRKQAISVLTGQHFDLFGAIGEWTDKEKKYPQPLLAEAEAEGRYIRFFEQAFEWEHMMYLFYPYFWGRKTNWSNRALMQDVDAQFGEFLKAGAARVVVPVRLGFETALSHFMDTGEIWDGADPPTLSSYLYVSIIEELKERAQAPDEERPQGPPWDVRLPTTLVRLRPGNTLPKWVKQQDGTWVSDED